MSLTRNVDVSLVDKIQERIALSANFQNTQVIDGFDETFIGLGRIIAIENIVTEKQEKLELNNDQNVINWLFELTVMTDKKGELDDLVDFLLRELHDPLDVFDFQNNEITKLNLNRMSFKNEREILSINGVNKFVCKITLGYSG